MEQKWGLQNTKTAGYILLVNSQSTICLVPNRQRTIICIEFNPMNFSLATVGKNLER